MKRISICTGNMPAAGLPGPSSRPCIIPVSKQPAGFSVTVPGIRQSEVIAEETDTGVNFYHAPSREKYGGEIGSR